jgi:hypothetical protein
VPRMTAAYCSSYATGPTVSPLASPRKPVREALKHLSHQAPSESWAENRAVGRSQTTAYVVAGAVLLLRLREVPSGCGRRKGLANRQPTAGEGRGGFARTSGCTARSASACGSRSTATSTEAASAISACTCGAPPPQPHRASRLEPIGWSGDRSVGLAMDGMAAVSFGLLWSCCSSEPQRRPWEARSEGGRGRGRDPHRCAAADEHGLTAPLNGHGGAHRDIAEVYLHGRQCQHVLGRLRSAQHTRLTRLPLRVVRGAAGVLTVPGPRFRMPPAAARELNTLALTSARCQFNCCRAPARIRARLASLLPPVPRRARCWAAGGAGDAGERASVEAAAPRPHASNL